jgi:hypothetical protein
MARLTITAALTLLGLLALAPVAPARVPDGFMGVMWDRAATHGSPRKVEAQWRLMARSGAQSVRTVFSWAHAQPVAGGPYHFAETDRLVALAARNDIALLPVIHRTPLWAALVPGEPGSPPRLDSDYTAYLRALVMRYGPQGTFWESRPGLPRRPLRDWQIWNEPHLQFYWNTAGRDPGAWAPEYARLLRASKLAIEAVDPRATIVLAGLADYSWKHLARLYRNGVRGQFDVAAINLFTGRPRWILRGLGLFRKALRRGGDGRAPVWVTETTWPAAKGRVARPEPAWQRAWYTTDRGMARRLRAVYRLASRKRRRLRLGRLYWYTWASEYRGGDLFGYSGLVRFWAGDFAPRPALDAYRASARRLTR